MKPFECTNRRMDRFIMINKLIIFSILLHLGLQQCTIGCLKCSISNSCLLCDISSNYYLQNQACVQQVIPNCNLATANGTCFQCSKGYYLDSSTYNCLSVPQANLIANCTGYSSSLSCQNCATSTFTQNGICANVTTVVPNCNLYINDGACRVCASGYILSANLTVCSPYTSINNCLKYSWGNCRSCVSGTVLDNNKFTSMIPINSLSFLLNSSYLSYLFETDKMMSGVPYDVCQDFGITGCQNSTRNGCIVCQAGYYLSSGICVTNPLPSIQFCGVYSSLNTCSACIQGYYFLNSVCTPVTPITGCSMYSPTATSSICVLCNTGSYVTGSGSSCTARVNSLTVQYCQTQNPTLDQCQACIAGYTLTSDNLKCLTTIPNCVTYTTSSKTSTALACSGCANTYYVSVTQTCTLGTLQNCLVYDQTQANVCVTCANAYYLSNAACLPQSPIQNCMTYSTSPNTCLTCALGYKLFSIGNVCMPGTSIANCATYSNDMATCLTCMSFFYMNASGNCIQIPQSYGSCLSLDNNMNCLQCSAGSAMFTPYSVSTQTVTICVLLPDYLTINGRVNTYPNNSVWSVTNNPTLVPFISGCSTNSYSYAPSAEETVCVLSSNFQLFSTASIVPNCIRYGMNAAATPTLVCFQCASGYYISGYTSNLLLATPTTCVSSCPTSGTYTLIYQDHLGLVNICVTSSLLDASIANGDCLVAMRTDIATAQIWNSANLSSAIACLSWGNQSSNMYPLNVVSSFRYESASATALTINPLSATVKYLGFISSEPGLSPSVFNYYGVQFTGIKTNLLNSVYTPSCNVFFTIDSGSIYKTPAYPQMVAAPATTDNVCLSCRFGFQPTYITMQGSSNYYYSPVCQQTATCQSSIILGGLPNYLNAMLSCHSCISSTPVIYMEYLSQVVAGNFGKILQYSVPDLSQATLANHGFRCTSASTIQTLVKTTASAPAAFTNCGVFGVFTQLTAVKTAAGTVFNFCLACSTGYYPIYAAASGTDITASEVPGYAVTACQASTSCDLTTSSKPFNTCPKCLANTAYTDLMMVNCITVASPNCLVIDDSVAISSTLNQCAVCIAGFFLNRDKKCETITIPNASSPSSFVNSISIAALKTAISTPNSPTELKYIRLQVILAMTAPAYGISSCNSNYIALPVYQRQGPILCVQSSYLASNPTIASSGTSFVQNCVIYQAQSTSANTGSFGCLACSATFIPLSDYSKCVSSATLPNCVLVLATTQTLCKTCADGYFNVNGVCSTTSIANCAKYLSTTSYVAGQVLLCSTCSIGYYLSTDATTCSLGSVANCASYQQASGTICLSCYPGYALAMLSGSVPYCFFLNGAASNCNLKISSGVPTDLTFQTGYLSCDKCINSSSQLYALLSFSNAPGNNKITNYCLPFEAVANCVAYDSLNALSSSTLSCTSCNNTNYYLNSASKSCRLRQADYRNCQTMDPFSDKCTACANGFVINPATSTCIANPTGIPNCIVYSNATSCLSCANGYYLSNNNCLLSTVVQNCNRYSSNYTCTGCADNYFLQNSTSCVLSPATGCLTFANVNACATCNSGFGLSSSMVNSVNVTSCVSNVITNCKVATLVAPFTCVTCNPQFYLSSATCVAVTTVITHCLVYDSATTCSQCDPNYVLIANRTICDSNLFSLNIGGSCADAVLLATPQCYACNPGYSVSNGACVQTPSSLTNCSMVDPTNSTQCLFCQPNTTYMASNLSCVYIQTQPPVFVPIPNPYSYHGRMILNLMFIGIFWFNRI